MKRRASAAEAAGDKVYTQEALMWARRVRPRALPAITGILPVSPKAKARNLDSRTPEIKRVNDAEFHRVADICKTIDGCIAQFDAPTQIAGDVRDIKFVANIWHG